MEIKYKQPLIVASIINMLLGAFLIICGILEFVGVLDTPANNSITTLGVQLSYVVFISGILVFISGIVTFLDRQRLFRINLDIFLGLIALAFPIFLSVVLILQAVICIRLLPPILSALFYMITVLVVKLANEEMRKTFKLNTRVLEVGQRRKQGVNVAAILASKSTSKAKTKNIATIGSLATGSQKRTWLKFDPRKLLQGRRRSYRGGFFKGFYSGSRRKRKF